ncbi:phosphate acyltransferase [Mycoplasmatota bacterium WC44]
MKILEKFRSNKSSDISIYMAVACPHDIESLTTLKKAIDLDIIDGAYLCGDQNIITKVADENGIDISNLEVVHSETMEQAARDVGELIKLGKAHFPMKGLIDTSVFLRAMLNKDLGLRTGRLLSHIMLLHRESDDLVYITTDAGMNIAPDLDQKADIIRNAVILAHSVGLDNPVVVPLTAKEKVYDKMPATVDADKLRTMNLDGEITGCRVSGPLQFDNAISEASAKMKGVKDELAGKADILLCPDIEAGNIFAKALTYLGDFIGYGLIMGAKVPMVVVSRSDGEIEKLGSIYLARLVYEMGNKNA